MRELIIVIRRKKLHFFSSHEKLCFKRDNMTTYGVVAMLFASLSLVMQM